jgi:cytochrome c553
MRLISFLTVLLATAAAAQNLADGKDVFGPCAACHGANGQGGKGGEYPRIAGQPATFIIESLKSFQSRERYNLPMVPYTEPRELSLGDMKDVAAYLESIKLPTRVPELPANATSLERLTASQRVLVVPPVKGDVEAGKRRFAESCSDCHGKDGRGRAKRDAPMLVGQYPNYLQRQYEAFKKGKRGAKDDDAMHDQLDDVTAEDFTNILAWLTSVQDQEPATAP